VLQEVSKAQAANRARLDAEYRRLVDNLVEAQQLRGGEEWLSNPTLPEDVVRESMPGRKDRLQRQHCLKCSHIACAAVFVGQWLQVQLSVRVVRVAACRDAYQLQAHGWLAGLSSNLPTSYTASVQQPQSHETRGQIASRCVSQAFVSDAVPSRLQQKHAARACVCCVLLHCCVC